MSVRSSARLRTRQSDEAKETDSAPAAAASTRRTRKRHEGHEQQQPEQAAEDALPAAAAASASSVPDSKRPRRSSRTRSSAAVASAESKEEDEEAADGDETKGPRAAAAESDDDSAAEDEGQQSASDEEDADAAMADASDTLLDSLRVATAGHLFSAAAVAGRPALTLRSVARVCDFLSAADIVLRLAPAARASYATAVEYAQIVAQNAASASEADATLAGSKKQSSRKRGGGGRAAAAASTAEPFSTARTAASCSVGRRSEVSVFTSTRSLTLLCASRLRSIVAGIHTCASRRSLSTSPLDARLLGRISDAIPTLTSLQCQLASSSVEPSFDFPVGLRDLHLCLKFFVAPNSSGSRGSLLRKPSFQPPKVARRKSSHRRKSKSRTSQPESWTALQCDQWAVWSVGKAAALPNLTTLTLSPSPLRLKMMWSSMSAARSKPLWLAPLVAAPSLRHLDVGVMLPQNHRDPSVLEGLNALWATTLRNLGQLERVSGSATQDLMMQLLEPHHSFDRLQRLPLENVQLTPALLESLKGLSRSLTDLRPHSLANVTDVTFLHDFAQLRHLNLFEQGPRPSYYDYDPQPLPTAPTAQHIVETIESLSLDRRTQLESIGIGSDSWTDELLLRLLTALPGLTELELRSKAVTSLAVLSAVAPLRSSLKVLRLCTPSVPRDDVTHLHALLQLESLSIAGSFVEPLYARQLFPFLPPYPKQPLHWLRSFVPRGAKEPVPTPPVDPAAKAAADAEFEARVRAGRVCAAELLNSAQLSCVMQFLDMKAFSIAARTCRSWRMAACLPSAWQLPNASAADLSSISTRPWSSMSTASQLSQGQHRVLVLQRMTPQLRPTILPTLPLCVHATATLLDLPLYISDLWQSSKDEERALLAIGQLPRLESLATTINMQSESASSVLMQLGPRLQHLECRHFPRTVLSHLSALTELQISGGGLRGEFSVLHRLRRLSLIGCTFGHELAIALRTLSRDHALHELNVAESSDLAVLLPVLAGESVEIPPNDEDDPPVAALTVPPSSPALLNRLRLLPDDGEAWSIASVLFLPRLRHFEFATYSYRPSSIDLTPLESFVHDRRSLPPIEVLHISAPLQQHTCEHIGLLSHLRQLRLTGVRARAKTPEEPVGDNNPRWASHLLQLQQLEVLELDAVEIHSLDVASLDQLPRLCTLIFIRQQSLRVCDLAVLPRIRGLTELQLDNNALLLLQKRDWFKDNGRQLPEEPEIAVVESDADSESQSMQDSEEADSGSESSLSVAAAASFVVPALPVDADGLLPLLLQCRSLRLLRWTSPAEHRAHSERYTSRHSWVQLAARVLASSSEIQQHRKNKEFARERQALRMLLSANPLLSVEVGVREDAYSAPSIRTVVLPPRSGSIADMEVSAAAMGARKLKPYEYDKVVSSNPSLQAYEDRALLSIEAEEELEWRADAERKAATKPKRRNKY